MDLGEWLTAMMTERGVNKTNLQHAARTNWSTVNNWFKGAQPNASSLQAIAETMRMTTTERMKLMELAAEAPGLIRTKPKNK